MAMDFFMRLGFSASKIKENPEVISGFLVNAQKLYVQLVLECVSG